MTSVAFFLIAAFWFLKGSRKPNWDPLAPIRLYGTMWFSSVAITTLYLSDLQMRWSILSWFCILGSIASFMAGTVVPKALSTKKNHTSTSVKFEFDTKRFLTIVAAIYSVCLCAYAFRVSSAGAVPALAANVEHARWLFYDIENGTTLDRATANVAFLFSTVIIACTLYYLSSKKARASDSRKVRWIIAFFLGTSVVLLALTAFRGAFFTPLIITGTLYHYLRKRFTAGKLILITTVGLILGLGIVVYRHLSSPAYALDSAYNLAEMKIPPEYALIAEPYSYVALSLDNMVQLFEHPAPWTFGALTFRPVWTILGLKGLFLENVSMPFQPAYGFNTATYLLPFYMDFGVVGVFILPFAFGWISSAIYNARRTRRDLSYLVGYSFVVLLIVLSVLDNIFVFSKFWMELGIVYCILRYCEIKPRVA